MVLNRFLVLTIQQTHHKKGSHQITLSLDDYGIIQAISHLDSHVMRISSYFIKSNTNGSTLKCEFTVLKKLTFGVNRENLIVQTLAEEHGCRTSMVDCRHSGSQNMNLLFEIEGDVATDFVDKLKRNREVKRAYFARSSPNRSLVMVVMKPPRFCSVARSANAFCVTCPYNSPVLEGKVEWELLVNDESDRETLIRELELGGEEGNAKKIETPLREDLLTARQREVLLSAIHLGYFDFPRRIGLTELAEHLGIRASTLSEIIRIAESKIAKAYANRLILTSSTDQSPRPEAVSQQMAVLLSR